MNTFFSRSAFCLFTFAFCLVLSGFAQNLTVRDIMAEPSIAGQRVEGEKLSPDGTTVVFLWNAEGRVPRDLYLVATSGGTPTIILKQSAMPVASPTPTPENKLDYGVEVRDEFVKVRENALGSFEWSPDSKKLVFTHNGDLYTLTLGEAKPKRFTKTQAPETGARFLDNDRIVYSSGGHAFVLNTADATTIQLTREANAAAFISIGGITPNKAGSMIAYVVADGSKQRQLVVPNFLPEYVTGGGPRRGWSEQKVMVMPTDGSRDAAFEVKLPKHEGVSNFRRMVWTADGRSLIIDRLDKDTKRRQLFYIHNVASKDEQTILVTEETDDKWQAPLSAIFEPHPKDARQLFFASERDGYNHLYLAKLTPNKPEPNPTGTIRQENPADPGFPTSPTITRLTGEGKWQVEWAKWDPHGEGIWILSTMKGTATRTIAGITTDRKIGLRDDLRKCRKRYDRVSSDIERKPGRSSNVRFLKMERTDGTLCSTIVLSGLSSLFDHRTDLWTGKTHEHRTGLIYCEPLERSKIHRHPVERRQADQNEDLPTRQP